MDTMALGLLRCLRVRLASTQHHFCWQPKVWQNFRQIKAAHAGKIHLGNHHIGWVIANLPQRVIRRLQHLNFDIIV
jgi:hypothetical protein